MTKRRWIRTAAALLFGFSPASAFAGAANAGIECQGTGRYQDVRIDGSIPGDFAEFSLKVQHGSAEMTYSDRETGQEIFVLKNFRKRVFSFVVRLPDGNSIEVYAVPRGFRARTRRHATNATFRAVLNLAPDPANEVETGGFLRDVPLRCEYDYAI